MGYLNAPVKRVAPVALGGVGAPVAVGALGAPVAHLALGEVVIVGRFLYAGIPTRR